MRLLVLVVRHNRYNMSSRNWEVRSEEDKHVIVIHQQQLVKCPTPSMCVSCSLRPRIYLCHSFICRRACLNTLVTNKVTYTNLTFVLLLSLSCLMNNVRPFTRLGRWCSIVLIVRNLSPSDRTVTNLLYYYVLSINQFSKFHDVTVSVILHVCLFYIFIACLLSWLRTFVLLSD